MSRLNVIQFLARVWFTVVVISALGLAALISHDATAADAKPPTQLSGGRNQTDQPALTGLTADGRISNPDEFLEDYSKTITDLKAAGKLDEALGIEKRVRRTEMALEEKGRIAVLLGDPKSGKTAIMRQYILENPQDTVYRLRLDKLYQLKKEDQIKAMKTLILNLETRARNLTGGKLIFFIDNLPALDQGAAVEIKPSGAILEAIAARRELPMVLETNGPTNRDLLQANAAVADRITTVEVEPAGFDNLVTFLRREKAAIQNSYRVPVTDDALVEAARIAQRYYANRPFDGADSLIKSAARRVYQEQIDGVSEAGQVGRDLSKLDAELKSLQDDAKYDRGSQLQKRIAGLQAERDKLQIRLDDLKIPDSNTMREQAELRRELSTLEENLERASGWFSGTERRQLQDQITAKTARLRELESIVNDASAVSDRPARRVGPEHVQIVASEYLGVPKSALSMNLDEAIKEIPQIKEAVLNQEHIIDRATEALSGYKEERRRREMIAKKEGKPPRTRPIWSALLAGRTGTGKTEFANQLARKLGADLLRFDMTEFQQSHAVARLIGAPPGYVGFEQGGELTNPVRERPFRVILFDEVEKAHPDVLKILMQVLDDARLTDGQGRTVSFEDCIILMTTNAGEQYAAMGRDQLIEHLKTLNVSIRAEDLQKLPLQVLRNEAVKGDLRAQWSEAVVGRIDDIMTTNNHTPEVIERISQMKVQALARESMEFDGIKLMASENAMRALVGTYRDEEGARSINSAFKRFFADPLSNARRQGQLSHGDVVLVDFANGRFDYTIATTDQLYKAQSGERAALDALKVKGAVKAEGKATRPRTPDLSPAKFWDPEFMVKNSTAKAMKRLRE